ncbi:MAG: hypothetical protein WBA91_11075 [Paracoccaceae bacterium]
MAFVSVLPFLAACSKSNNVSDRNLTLPDASFSYRWSGGVLELRGKFRNTGDVPICMGRPSIIPFFLETTMGQTKPGIAPFDRLSLSDPSTPRASILPAASVLDFRVQYRPKPISSSPIVLMGGTPEEQLELDKWAVAQMRRGDYAAIAGAKIAFCPPSALAAAAQSTSPVAIGVESLDFSKSRGFRIMVGKIHVVHPEQ